MRHCITRHVACDVMRRIQTALCPSLHHGINSQLSDTTRHGADLRTPLQAHRHTSRSSFVKAWGEYREDTSTFPVLQITTGRIDLEGLLLLRLQGPKNVTAHF